MKNILYIWGAGASANALPIVSEMPVRMKMFAFISFVTGDKDLSKNIFNLVKKIEKTRSFDTYAKEIYLKEDNDNHLETDHLKNILVKYLKFEEENTDYDIRNIIQEIFSLTTPNIKVMLTPNKHREIGQFYRNIEFIADKYIEKNITGNDTSFLNKKIIIDVLNYIFTYNENFSIVENKNSLDPRYINFLIDILGTNESLRKIKILSWNYDNQFKKAIKELEIEKNEQKELDGVSEILKELEIKINGSIDEKNIKFAWEHNNDIAYITSKLDNSFLQSINDIVIIGYSFPFSNRKQDIKIFKEVRRFRPNGINLYVQTLDDRSFNEIKESLESILIESGYQPYYVDNLPDEKWPFKIIKKISNNSFFIPPHY